MSPLRIGFVSTRFHGTDGVSLEVRKWVAVLREMGHECFFFAGQSEWPEDVSFVVPEEARRASQRGVVHLHRTIWR